MDYAAPSLVRKDFLRLDDVLSRVPDRSIDSFQPDENPGLVIVDKDNLDRYAEECGFEFYLDDVVDALISSHTGIDELVGVCVFTTDNGVVRRYEVQLRDADRFCLHVSPRQPGEPGYPDDEMYRCAWRHHRFYRTVCYLSHDGGVAQAAAEHRRGYNRFNGLEHYTAIREAVVVSPHWGHTSAWHRIADEPIDLDVVLAQLGYRSPVVRPA